MIPDCSKWSVWSGPEIEGEGNDLRVPTLFVRRGWRPHAFKEDADLLKGHKAVWFCMDFIRIERDALEVIEWAYMNADRVSIEVGVDTWFKYPQTLRNRCRLYFVAPPSLKQSDYVKVGPDYFQTCLRVGSQKPTVKPIDYGQDVIVKP